MKSLLGCDNQDFDYALRFILESSKKGFNQVSHHASLNTGALPTSLDRHSGRRRRRNRYICIGNYVYRMREDILVDDWRCPKDIIGIQRQNENVWPLHALSEQELTAMFKAGILLVVAYVVWPVEQNVAGQGWNTGK